MAVDHPCGFKQWTHPVRHCRHPAKVQGGRHLLSVPTASVKSRRPTQPLQTFGRSASPIVDSPDSSHKRAVKTTQCRYSSHPVRWSRSPSASRHWQLPNTNLSATPVCPLLVCVDIPGIRMLGEDCRPRTTHHPLSPRSSPGDAPTRRLHARRCLVCWSTGQQTHQGPLSGTHASC